MARGEQQSDIRAVLVRNSYDTGALSGFAAPMRNCEPVGVRKNPDGEIFFAIYLSSQGFLSTNCPPLNLNESQRPYSWNLVFYAPAEATCWDCGSPTTRWEAHSQALPAFEDSGRRIPE